MTRTLGLAEFIAARRDRLPPQERALMEQVFVHGRPLTHLAALAGVPWSRMRRRVGNLVERITSPTFDAVNRHSAGWAPAMRAIGEAVFVRGLSVRAASAETGVPYRAAIVHARTIKSIAAELNPARSHKGAPS